jgi:hypothetical protein
MFALKEKKKSHPSTPLIAKFDSSTMTTYTTFHSIGWRRGNTQCKLRMLKQCLAMILDNLKYCRSTIIAESARDHFPSWKYVNSSRFTASHSPLLVRGLF